jgi:hypothetical protein
MKRLRIVLPGGSGHVGTLLARAWHARGDEVVVLSRAARAPSPAAPWRTVAWDGVNAGPWCDEIEGADVVVNLAGRSVDCRYGAANRRAIMDSRVLSTRAVGAAIASATNPPRVWLQASTATIYAHRFDAPNDDVTGIIGGDESNAPDTWRFSIEVAKAWEAAAREAHTPHTRLVLLRSAMTMSPDPGGIFDTLLTLVRRGLGGTCGDGRQYVSWIHETDFVRALDFIVERDDMDGAVAIASPHPLPNREFMADLRRAWGARFGLPATRWMLEIGARILRTETELILKSRRVVPTRLLEAGFTFELPHWRDAAAELCARVRALKAPAS